MMSLSMFIADHFDPILQEWESFARSVVPRDRAVSVEQLRDHAVSLLQTVVRDLATPQSEQQGAAKSKGNGPQPTNGHDSAAQSHANARHAEGFDLVSIVAEFRALRASVMRLWSGAHEPPSGSDVEQITRFNEAIDQALAESVARFYERAEKDRNLFLAVLGHDLRTPLSAIVMAARTIQGTDDVERIHAVTARILSSSARIQHMVNDLLEFTRMRLRGDFPIRPVHMNLGELARKVIDEARLSHAGSVIECTIGGEVEGYWDEARIAQLLSNLLTNAIQHGVRNARVGFSALGNPEGVCITVHNQGLPIPAARLPHIFDPLERGDTPDDGASSPAVHLGLGLYIVRQIAMAHEGRVDVTSSEQEGTTFRVWLPHRRQQLPSK